MVSMNLTTDSLALPSSSPSSRNRPTSHRTSCKREFRSRALYDAWNRALPGFYWWSITDPCCPFPTSIAGLTCLSRLVALTLQATVDIEPIVEFTTVFKNAGQSCRCKLAANRAQWKSRNVCAYSQREGVFGVRGCDAAEGSSERNSDYVHIIECLYHSHVIFANRTRWRLARN